MNADRLFMLVDTCANIDEVKHELIWWKINKRGLEDGKINR